MASATLPRRAYNLNFMREHRNNQRYSTDDEETNSIILNNSRSSRKYSKPIRTLSCDQAEVQSSSPLTSPTITNNNNNRLKELCSRLKRRLTLTKDQRARSVDHTNPNRSARSSFRFSSYKTFSSSIDDPSTEFEWPDFEKVYDSIPPCLINALPGLDDFSLDESDNYSFNSLNFETDSTDQYSIEQMNLFIKCKRGKSFRRNAICQKLDKSHYHGQLDVFVQQLMIEKLMRTWT